MLRIIRTQEADTTILRLEGKLLEPWLDEVRTACIGLDGLMALTRLDLSGVTYTDDAGMGLLKELQRLGVRLTCCTSYLRTLLQEMPS